MPPRYADVIRCEKPVDASWLVGALFGYSLPRRLGADQPDHPLFFDVRPG